MPRITHLELCSDVPETLGSFYAEVFGWMVQKKQAGKEDYWFMLSGGMNDASGINAGMKKRLIKGLQWIPTIHVDGIDAVLEKIRACGGKIKQPKQPITATGYLAYCEDPEGNLFGILEKDSSVR